MATEITLEELQTKFVKVQVIEELCGIKDSAVRKAAGRFTTETKAGRGRYMLADFIKAYIEEIKQGQGITEGELDGPKERARVDKERADQLALKNAERRGELRDLEGFLMINAQIAQITNTHLSAIPARIANQIAAETGANPEEIRRLLQKEIDEARQDLSQAFQKYAEGVEDLDEPLEEIR